MSVLRLDGEALAEFTFMGLPSWNTILGKHWRSQGRITKEYRTEGATLARSWMNKFRGGRGPLLAHHILLVAWVYTPGEIVMDIYNIAIKAVGDGFTDANIWPDDEWTVVPVTLFSWAGIESGPESRTVIEVHELEKFYHNGRARNLPKGRTRL
jgi:hypothetical protein